MRLLELDPIQAEANRIREAAGIRPVDAVPEIGAVLRAVGLVVAVRDLAPDGLDGIYAAAGVVVLNAAKFPYRQRFVAAHLLAHHTYGDEPHVDHDVEAETDDPAHCRANAFAARFLVSGEAIRARCQPVGLASAREGLDLARELGVGSHVLLGRLCEAGVQVPVPSDPIRWRDR
jgi:Zn-dependent peptidase ImmA (M78 family)